MKEDFVYKGNGLIRFWLIAAGVQGILFVIAAIVSAAVYSKDFLLLDFLTLTKGTSKIAGIGILMNLVICGIDFYLSYMVHKDAVATLKTNTTFKEITIITKAKRHLEIILSGLVVYIFLQMLLGILWWMIGIILFVYKYIFYKNLNNLKKY